MKVLLTVTGKNDEVLRVEGPLDLEPGQVAQRMSEIGSDKNVVGIGMTRLDIVCDFCSASDPISIFQCQDSEIMGVGPDGSIHLDVDGKWAACVDCDKDVKSRLMHEVARRSFNNFISAHPEMHPILVAAMIAEAHAIFWTGWDNQEPTPIPQDSEIFTTKEREPVIFCFRAYDMNTNALVGGGRYDAFYDDEAAHSAAFDNFTTTHPNASIHIEQITEDEYEYDVNS